MPRTIVLATANPHKVAELRAILGAAGDAGGSVRVLGLGDVRGGAGFREPVEHGSSFEENAEIKAVSYAAQVAAAVEESPEHEGWVCLADDSGLEVEALGGRPGVISSHYCTGGQERGMSRAERDAANNALLLKELEGVPFERRGARFVCCMCAVSAPATGARGQVVRRTRGTFEGRIGLPPRVPAGDHGFGYDPLFMVGPGHERTGAELSEDEKNRLSHRAMAAGAMAAWLRGA